MILDDPQENRDPEPRPCDLCKKDPCDLICPHLELSMNISTSYLPQRKEDDGWRSIGFPQNNIEEAKKRGEKIKQRGYEVRIVCSQTNIICAI